MPANISIPTIDIAPYHPSTFSLYTPTQREATGLALHEACRDVGFFYLCVDHFFSDDKMKRILDVGREFFNAPREVKEGVHISKGDGSRGWQRMKEEITLGLADHHEGYDLYAPSPYPSSPAPAPTVECPAHTRPISFSPFSTDEVRDAAIADSMVDTNAKVKREVRLLEGANPFPESPSDFESTVQTWTEGMKVLGLAVMQGMSDGLGLGIKESKELRETMERSFWYMRLIGYPPLAADAEGISCGAHKDYGCLTFLHADPSPGSLQILPHISHPSKATTPLLAQTDDQEWISANPPPGCIVVNIGRMWSIWSGGLYPATLHRVIHTLPTQRISVPFFFEPSFDARVRVLDGARRKIREEDMEVWDHDEVVYGDFLVDRIKSNLGIKQ